MYEELIAFETAKLAKEKGYENIKIKKKGAWETFIADNVPTQSLLQRWLREKHGIFIVLLPDSDNGMFGYDILIKGDIHTQANTFELDEVIGTYEEALEQGLLEGLKLIK